MPAIVWSGVKHVILNNRIGFTNKETSTVAARANLSCIPKLAPFLMGMVAIAAACTTSVSIPELEQRAYNLNQAIMCPVCPGESIDQSQNPLAVTMRGIVVQKLAQGESGDDIKAFFVERYGESVLLSPPGEGISLAVWLLPPFGAAAAIGVALMFLRSMRKTPVPSTQQAVNATHLSSDERDRYIRRIEEALGDPQAPPATNKEASRRVDDSAGPQTGNRSA